jgi:hypothetical protein
LLPVVARLADVVIGLVGAGKSVVSAGLLAFVADLAGQRECGGVLGAGMTWLSVWAVKLAKAVVSLGFTRLVADVAEQREAGWR